MVFPAGISERRADSFCSTFGWIEALRQGGDKDDDCHLSVSSALCSREVVAKTGLISLPSIGLGRSSCSFLAKARVNRRELIDVVPVSL